MQIVKKKKQCYGKKYFLTYFRHIFHKKIPSWKYMRCVRIETGLNHKKNCHIQTTNFTLQNYPLTSNTLSYPSPPHPHEILKRFFIVLSSQPSWPLPYLENRFPWWPPWAWGKRKYLTEPGRVSRWGCFIKGARFPDMGTIK